MKNTTFTAVTDISNDKSNSTVHSYSSVCNDVALGSFVFYKDWYETIMLLPADLQLEAFRSLFGYAFNNEQTQNPLLKAVLLMMMNAIDRNKVKYQQKVERLQRNRRNAREQKENQAIKVGNQPTAQPTPARAVEEPLPNPQPNPQPALQPALQPMSEREQEDLKLKADFEAFRKAYPGSKCGLDTEFANLKNRHGERWREIVPLLTAGLERENAHIEARYRATNFKPNRSTLTSWINNSRWEMEYPDHSPKSSAAPAPQPSESHETFREQLRRERDEIFDRNAQYRDRYRQRVPDAYTDKALLTFAQYMIT